MYIYSVSFVFRLFWGHQNPFVFYMSLICSCSPVLSGIDAVGSFRELFWLELYHFKIPTWGFYQTKFKFRGSYELLFRVYEIFSLYFYKYFKLVIVISKSKKERLPLFFFVIETIFWFRDFPIIYLLSKVFLGLTDVQWRLD